MFIFLNKKNCDRNASYRYTPFYTIAIAVKTSRTFLVVTFYWRLRTPSTTSREYASDVNSARRRKCSVSAAVAYPSPLTSPRSRESMLRFSANVWKARRLVFSRMVERKWLRPLEAAGFLRTKANSSRLTLPLSCALIISTVTREKVIRNCILISMWH